MLAAAFLGFLIAKIGSGFKSKNMIQTVLTFLFVLLCFASRFFLEDMFKNNKTREVLETVSDSTEQIAGIYLPAGWFSEAVTDIRISDMMLLVGISILLFEIVFLLVGGSYRKINSALKSHAASGGFVMEKQKTRSVIGSLAFKEFKRMTGSTVYMTNAVMGELLCLIMGIAVLFVDIDKVLNSMMKGAPVTKEMLYPAIPFVVYLFIGMVATTAFTPSLEGKNYWILQSLPLKKKTIYQGKMLFNMLLTVPFMAFSTITFSIAFRVSAISMVLYLILGISLCAFSTAWGCVCGIKHMRLDWENEVEVIKQGAAVAIYMFPNMFACMGLLVLVVFLGKRMDQNLVTAIMIPIVAVLAVICYSRVMSLSREESAG
jgi:ABC-2 type transport system permease protein